ncbi:hypothetical protein [Aeromicrobium sp. NPDC092404]|uniref:hypothetical protein n=1 Tax=Aeromicrobium sp. NPDC092404 TaxID=3154976 RepID=UPI00341D49B7
MGRMKVVVVVMMILSLSGCGGSDEPDARPDERAEVTRAAAAEVFPLIGKAVEALSYSSTGGGAWSICGMEPSPSGAEYVAEVAVTQTNVGSSQYPQLIESALTSAGWKVGTSSSELVKAAKDGLDLRARFGAGGINLSVTSGCLDLSKDTIRELTDKPRDDLGLSLP